MNRPNKAISEKRGPPEGELRKRNVLQNVVVYVKINLFCLQVKAVKKPFIWFHTLSHRFPRFPLFFAGIDDEFPTVLGDFASAADAICRTLQNPCSNDLVDLVGCSVEKKVGKQQNILFWIKVRTAFGWILRHVSLMRSQNMRNDLLLLLLLVRFLGLYRKISWWWIGKIIFKISINFCLLNTWSNTCRRQMSLLLPASCSAPSSMLYSDMTIGCCINLHQPWGAEERTSCNVCFFKDLFYRLTIHVCPDFGLL